MEPVLTRNVRTVKRVLLTLVIVSSVMMCASPPAALGMPSPGLRPSAQSAAEKILLAAFGRHKQNAQIFVTKTNKTHSFLMGVDFKDRMLSELTTGSHPERAVLETMRYPRAKTAQWRLIANGDTKHPRMVATIGDDADTVRVVFQSLGGTRFTEYTLGGHDVTRSLRHLLVMDFAARAMPRTIDHWPLDDVGGSTSAADTSSGHTATCVHCPEFGAPGHIGAAASFDGSGSLLVVPNTIPTSFTVTAWIKTGQTFGKAGDPAYNGAGVIYSDAAGKAADMIPMALSGDRLVFGTGEAAGCSCYDTLTSRQAISTGKWVFVAVTRDATSGAKQIYINAVLDSSSVGITGALSANPGIDIGGNTLDARYFAGSIDDVRFYDRVLDSQQIAHVAQIGSW